MRDYIESLKGCLVWLAIVAGCLGLLYLMAQTLVWMLSGVDGNLP